MNNSSEVHRLANSIAGLVETITAKVKETNGRGPLRMRYCSNRLPIRQITAEEIVRRIGATRVPISSMACMSLA